MTVLKLYTASWCSPCRHLKPILNEIISQNPHVNYKIIDVDENKDETISKGIRSVPVVIIEKNGVETSRFVGIQPKSTYEGAI